MSDRNEYWKPGNGQNGQLAHEAFNAYLPTIGYDPGRELTWPGKRTHLTGPAPDGFTPSGRPVELKSEHKLHARATREQVLKALRLLGCDHGEVWLWEPDGDGFRFTKKYEVNADGTVQETDRKEEVA